MLSQQRLEAQSPVIPSADQRPRISSRADFTAVTRLSGHRTEWSVPANDVGVVPSNTALHLQLLLARDPQVQAAFEQRLADQQSPSSPFFHRWLTPQQIGQMYGPASTDIATVRSWLSAKGLQVDAVAPSGIFLQFSGQASIVEAAFATSLHLYTVPGTTGEHATRIWRAPTSEPAIPVAFTAVVSAIEGLTEVPFESQHHEVPGPQFNSSNGKYFISPGDFAVIYHLNPLYTAGINGAGYKVAIIGLSQVNPADISMFESIFNLPSKPANIVIPTQGADPGQPNNNDQGEATLDVERVVGTAPGAQPDLIVSSEATGGLITAISYNVQTLLDPIMTISFGTCEARAGQAMTNFYASLFSQGAAEGISTFISSGDSGAAGCDMHGQAPPTTQSLSINAYCATGFVTCVGGTEFNDATNASTYWATMNTNRVSAMDYIPEGAWNEPMNASGNPIITASGGGVSLYVPKPAFQTGIGVPADGMRDVPDISFSSAGHDAYIVCYSGSSSGGCTQNASTGGITFTGDSGTSAAAPSMAAITALLDQKLGGPQGALNPLIYRLANRVYSSAFHDVTPDSSGVLTANCTTATPNMCNNSTPNQAGTGLGQAGYLVTTGYDQVTGWGSLDVANFVTAAATTGVPTTTTLTGSSGTISGSQTLSFSTAVTSSAAGTTSIPSGAVQFYVSGVPTGSAQNLSSLGQATYSVASSTLPYGAAQITAIYSGDSTFEGSSSEPLTFTLNPGGTATATLTLTASPSSGDPTTPIVLTATLGGTGSSIAPTALISLYAVDGGSLALLVRQNQSSSRLTYNANQLAAGTHTFKAIYPGDSTYAPIASTPLAVTINALPTTTTVSGPATTGNASATSLSATVSGLLANYTSSTTGVQFFDGTALLGSVKPTLVSSSSTTTTATASISPTLSVGTHSIAAKWPGDFYTAASASAVLMVVSVAPSVTLTAAIPSVTIASPGVSATDSLTVTSVGNYAGSVNLSCAVSYTGSATVQFQPTCSLSSSSVSVTAGGTATSILSVSTTAPQTSSKQEGPAPSGYKRSGGIAFSFIVLGLTGVFAKPKGIDRSRMLGIVLILATSSALLCATGCIHHHSTTPGTTPATYTVTISGGPGTTSENLASLSVYVQ